MAASVLTTSLLDAVCPQCNTCFERAKDECVECGQDRPDGDWPSLREYPYPFLGRVVDGRYLIDRFLDSGASGHVYRARGLRFRRPFALKIVDARRFEEGKVRQKVIERFHAEVDAITQIRNPHVIDVYEAIELDKDIFGLVMNFVEGRTLEQILEERGYLPVDDALAIAAQLANGLHEAHSRGIIHRDLKPANVMIEELPASGLFARVLDFGIARDIEEDGSSSGSFGFQGTPLYAAPEQCTEEAPPDARSDIYSLGCLIYHMLTGQPPFAYTNALRVMDAHVHDRRPRLAEANEEQSFSEPLEFLVGHLMARDRADRPNDLHLIYEDLMALQKGRSPRHFGNRPVGYDEPSQSDADRGHFAVTTPPPFEWVSLSEWTSTELANDPTMTEAEEAPWLASDTELDMELVSEVESPFERDSIPMITAAVLDPKGMACVFADAKKSVHLVGLGAGAFRNSIAGSKIICATDLDLHAGYMIVAGREGQICELDPGTGRRRSEHQVDGSPLALELVSSGPVVYYGLERGQLWKLDLRTNSSHELLRFPDAISTLSAGRKGAMLVGLWDGSMAFVDGDEQLKWHLPVAPDAIADVGLLDDEHYFALDGRGGFHIGALAHGQVLRTISVGAGLRTVRRLVDGRIVALSLFGATVQAWQLKVN